MLIILTIGTSTKLALVFGGGGGGDSITKVMMAYGVSDRSACSCLAQVQHNTQYLLGCEGMTSVGNVGNVRTD